MHASTLTLYIKSISCACDIYRSVAYINNVFNVYTGVDNALASMQLIKALFTERVLQ